jgi:uncharacterized protein YbcI
MGFEDGHEETLTAAVARALVGLHKEQFGRGPTRARAHFFGADMLVCAFEDVLVPAELKLVDRGQDEAVQTARVLFQIATKDEFIATIEQLVERKVRAFTSSVDPTANMLFEIFVFESEADGEGDATG